MAILSKIMHKSMSKCEDLGYGKDALSKGLVGFAIFVYTVKLSYPILKRRLGRTVVEQDIETNSLNSTIKNGSVDKFLDEDVQAKIEEAEKIVAQTQKRQTQPGLNFEFLLNLKQLIEIMVPRPICHESGLLGIHTLCLISRTFLSIYVAELEGAIVKFIVRKDVENFAWMLLKWFGIAIPATFINSMIRYLENRLALAFRTRLVKYSYRLYFKNQNYYRVSNLDGRIENADHRLTEDISVFTTSVAHLYGHLTKPCFDLLLIGLSLMRSSQRMKASVFSGPLLAFVVISTTAHILRVVSPKFGMLVSEEANRYGYLRHIHSRIITNAEEIAFYGGHKVELVQLREAYNRLATQMKDVFSQKLWFVMLEQFFMKYVWSGTGMIMVSLPILTTVRGKNGHEKDAGTNVSERTQYLTTARNLLLSAADAIERLMSSYKEIVTLAGYTHRVAGMLQVFEETACGIYSKTISDSANCSGIIEFHNGQPVAKGHLIYTDDDTIILKNIPIVTPNCDIIVPSLTLSIEPGMHLFITGPNGCGKSSLFRILSGLWPIYGGELHIPRLVEGKPCMFYIPQRPYMSIGSLCDQIIYPDTREDMIRKNVTESQLRDILRMVALEHIAARGSFNVIKDWKDILSGGEKQRMAIARLFYHKPRYALLDECTSAVSIDVESSIYEIAKDMGITLMTITHRPSLRKFHTHILEFDGQGNWELRHLTNGDENTQYKKLSSCNNNINNNNNNNINNNNDYSVV